MLSTQFIHLLLLPPGLQCVLAVLALLLAWQSRRYSATALAVLAIASMYLLAIPVGSSWIARPLEARVQPLTDLTQLKAAGYGAIVVLGGGRTPRAPEFAGLDVSSPSVLARLRYAARAQRQSGLPILVTGGMPLSTQRPEAELMAESLREDFGVPVRWLEQASKTTAENAELTAAILLPLGIRQVVLVSHASHLPRAVKNFERAGFSVLPAPTQFTTEAQAYSVVERWTPQHESLAHSRRALHEWLGLARDSLR